MHCIAAVSAVSDQAQCLIEFFPYTGCSVKMPAFLRQPFFFAGNNLYLPKLFQFMPQDIHPAFPAFIHFYKFRIGSVIDNEFMIGFRGFSHQRAMLHAAHHIKISQVSFFVCEDLVFALSVQVQQESCNFFQYTRGDRDAVYPAYIPPGLGKVTIDDHRPAVPFDLFPIEDLLQVFCVFCLKFRFNGCPFASRTDQITIRASAKDQSHCVDDNTLAGTGFSRQDIHPFMKFDFDLFNQRNVVDRERTNHVLSLFPGYSFPVSFRILAAISAASFSLRTATKMVLSPAIVPSTSFQFILSMASAATFAEPLSVLTTTI